MTLLPVLDITVYFCRLCELLLELFDDCVVCVLALFSFVNTSSAPFNVQDSRSMVAFSRYRTTESIAITTICFYICTLEIS